MFALRPAIARHRVFAYPRPHLRTHPGRRYYAQSLGDGFLDLALALPIPPEFPAYSTTIILVTIVSRLALLPVSIWVRLNDSRRLPAVDVSVRANVVCVVWRKL